MGDRANIVMKQGTGDAEIFFYTHWRGEGVPTILQAGLRRGVSRWNDEPYLARIIFCELVRGYEGDKEGFGISVYQTDSEHDFLVVNCEEQEVTRESRSGRTVLGRWSFKEYTELKISEVFKDY